jgi:hypothetical protein
MQRLKGEPAWHVKHVQLAPNSIGLPSCAIPWDAAEIQPWAQLREYIAVLVLVKRPFLLLCLFCFLLVAFSRPHSGGSRIAACLYC